ncbi:MAG TPA: DNA repair protein RadA [Actinomycetota bacterium]|nr:DNA repair protein RadA [Actinomycetota bacterium]
MSEIFTCSGCSFASHKWFGRCPECGAWSTATTGAPGASTGLVVAPLADASPDAPRAATGIDELDRVLGGGVVRGSAVLLAGEPGIGKSTLVLQLLDSLAAAGAHVLLVSGEESAEQISGRAARMAVDPTRLNVAASTSLTDVLGTCATTRPDVVVIDSIQTLVDDRLDHAAGSLVQIRECAGALVQHAKGSSTTFVLVGHVTKDGAVAGPKTLEHMVDVVLSLEGERSGPLRLLRAAKNRFGATDETGVFMMTTKGLDPVGDPSALLLADRRSGVPGSIVFPSIEGSRPVLVEVQALVDKAPPGQARRVAIGLDQRRLSLLIAVLSARAEVRLADHDVFVAAAGGLAIREPAADLAVCLAMFSGATGVPLDDRAVALGEVGLSGEVRRVPGIARRLGEARRLGFTSAFVPYSFDEAIAGLRLLRVPDVVAAFHQARGPRDRAGKGRGEGARVTI